MEWAVAQHADVVSMSLGGDTGDGTDPLEQAVDDLSASSPTLFVIAAGNNGDRPGTVTSPGAAYAALTVGAVDSTDTMAFFSSRGPRLDGTVKPEVVAPGVDIVAARAAGTSLGTPVDDFYTTLSGTSMATPHVAAVAAILKQEHPGWDGERLKAAIVGSTVPVAGAIGVRRGHRPGRRAARPGPRPSSPTAAQPRLLRLAALRPLADEHAADLHERRQHRRDLALALTSQDGSGDGPPGRHACPPTTSPCRPAGPRRSTSWSTRRSPRRGAYSGVVTATPQGGGQTVRTAVGYGLEAERVRPDRRGHPAHGHPVGLARRRAARLRRLLLPAAHRRRRSRRAADHLPRPAGPLQRERGVVRHRDGRLADRRARHEPVVHGHPRHHRAARREPDPARSTTRPTSRS